MTKLVNIHFLSTIKLQEIIKRFAATYFSQDVPLPRVEPSQAGLTALTHSPRNIRLSFN